MLTLKGQLHFHKDKNIELSKMKIAAVSCSLKSRCAGDERSIAAVAGEDTVHQTLVCQPVSNRC